MANVVPPVVLKPSARHTATLIFLHGLGDTGVGWAGALNTIRPPHLKVICPTAPMMPVTLNHGFRMPSWYDIYALTETEAGRREDLEGVALSFRNLEGLIEAETSADIPRSRIVIGGFSQGGAVALFTTLNTKTPLAGCIALSSYLPGALPSDDLPQHGCLTPIVQCHGKSDSVVTFDVGQRTHNIIKRLVKDLEFHQFDNMGHESTPEEMQVVKNFLNRVVP